MADSDEEKINKTLKLWSSRVWFLNINYVIVICLLKLWNGLPFVNYYIFNLFPVSAEAFKKAELDKDVSVQIVNKVK